MKLKHKIFIYSTTIILAGSLDLYSHLNDYKNGFIKGKEYVINNTSIKDKKATYTIQASCGGF